MIPNSHLPLFAAWGISNRYPNRGAPVAVQTIVNIRHITANGEGLRPGTVRIVWEEPIETEGLDSKDIENLKEKAENLMKQRLGFEK